MSKNNGDRARAGRERKKKLLRRKNTDAIRQTLAAKPVAPVVKEQDGKA